MYTDLQKISSKRLQARVNDFTDNKREPVWEADRNDGEWCFPQDTTIQLLKDVIDYYEAELLTSRRTKTQK